MTQVEATIDANGRAKKYGIDWHVVRIHNEEIGWDFTAVSTHYFVQHPHAHSLYHAKAPDTEVERPSRWIRIIRMIRKFFTFVKS